MARGGATREAKKPRSLKSTWNPNTKPSPSPSHNCDLLLSWILPPFLPLPLLPFVRAGSLTFVFFSSSSLVEKRRRINAKNRHSGKRGDRRRFVGLKKKATLQEMEEGKERVGNRKWDTVTSFPLPPFDPIRIQSGI